jgi:hypothetical protein
MQLTHSIPSTLEVESAVVLTILLGTPLHHPRSTAIRAGYQWEPAQVTNWIRSRDPAACFQPTPRGTPHSCSSRRLREIRHGRHGRGAGGAVGKQRQEGGREMSG